MILPTTSRALLLCAFGFALAAPEPASAFACTVDPQSVAFGAYDSVSGAAVDGVGYISLGCDSPTSIEIRLSTGASGSYDERIMSSGGPQMRYNLYTDSSRAAVWGDGAGGSGTVSATIGTSRDVTVYGRIAPNQNLPAGTYADVIVVTLTY